MYFIQCCFICRPSAFTVSEDAGIEPGTLATSAMTVRRSNFKISSRIQSNRIHSKSPETNERTNHTKKTDMIAYTLLILLLSAFTKHS
jgi:hypothetical protein